MGYHTLLASIGAWPEFNLFTAGYSMNGTPADMPRFRRALEWQWQNLDVHGLPPALTTPISG